MNLFTVFTFLLVLGLVTGIAQNTNNAVQKKLAPTTGLRLKTNAPPTFGEKKLSAIRQLNEYFNIERDQVLQETKITSKYMSQIPSGDDFLEMEIICRVNAEKPIPEFIYFHFTQASGRGLFRDYSLCIFNLDGVKKDYGNLEVSTHILPSGRVLEQMFLQLSYEEFETLVHSKRALMNLGIINSYDWEPTAHASWPVLLNYFNILKAEQKAKDAPKEHTETRPQLYTPFYTPRPGFTRDLAHFGPAWHNADNTKTPANTYNLTNASLAQW